MPANPHAARLRNQRGESVTFESTPDIIETRNVNYNTMEPTHMPGQIYTYKSTSSRVYNISNVRFISRSQGEAQRNLIWLWRLRGWCMPEFGVTSEVRQWEWPEWDFAKAGEEDRARDVNSSLMSSRFKILEEQQAATANFGVNPIGTPPDVLFFSAYSAGDAARQHITNVPVVIQQLSIPYPSDVDYISTPLGVPMPTILTVDITLIETHAPVEYENFSLAAFKQGLLGNF